MPLILASEFSDSFHKTQELLGDNLIGKKVTVILTAANGLDLDPSYPLYERTIKPFEDLGLKVIHFDLEEKSSQEVKDQILSSDIIYVCGGNTFYLLKYMNDCNFKETLIQFLRQDGLYIGSSAGAIVMSPDIGFISIMDNQDIQGLNNHTGLNLIDFSFLPHLDHDEMGEDAHEIIEKYKNTDQTILALNDDQALYINANIIRLI